MSLGVKDDTRPEEPTTHLRDVCGTLGQQQLSIKFSGCVVSNGNQVSFINCCRIGGFLSNKLANCFDVMMHATCNYVNTRLHCWVAEARTSVLVKKRSTWYNEYTSICR